MVASMLANIHRDRKKRVDPFDWFNFIPWIKQPKGYMKDRIKRMIPGLPRGK